MATQPKDELIIWLSRNRGILTKISRFVRPPCTSQFVSQVARGSRKSRDGNVERELRKYGAPI